MKKCPYCAEEIKDEAIICRYCGKDLPLNLSKNANLPTIISVLLFIAGTIAIIGSIIIMLKLLLK